MKNSAPLGVDIIEWKKAGAFYRRHQDCLERLFSKEERRFIEQSKKPAETFAMIFSAKESVFKATVKTWMGADGFKKLRIHPSESGSFTFLDSRSAKKFKIIFQKTRRHLVSYCYPRSL